MKNSLRLLVILGTLIPMTLAFPVAAQEPTPVAGEVMIEDGVLHIEVAKDMLCNPHLTP